jgi:hypothetical protein
VLGDVEDWKRVSAEFNQCSAKAILLVLTEIVIDRIQCSRAVLQAGHRYPLRSCCGGPDLRFQLPPCHTYVGYIRTFQYS